MKNLKPSDIVILGNPRPRHCRNKEFRRIIEAIGARLLFPPTCSPDPNPVERAFARIEALLRKAETQNCEAVRDIPESFTPEECANHFGNSGYGSF